jgi:hypothetical protein
MLVLTGADPFTPSHDLGSDPGEDPEQDAQQTPVDDSGHASCRASITVFDFLLAVDT